MNRVLDRCVPWLAYPGTIALGLVGHVWLSSHNSSLLVSTYMPVCLAALLVMLLERRFPNEARWKPDLSEVGQDTLYMLVVQMVLPKLLAFAVALAALNTLGSDHAPFHNGWPHQWPAAWQAVLMVVLADFLRYWLHRAAHRVPWLWRLHAVHHSPQRLYWLNVGRFHPLEKALQFLLDTVPFILLGVSDQVIALYFVFYAINGFFQHSNITLRYGLLNYVISGAELHRWHHSRLPEESNTNFGNNVILWDLLFGTRYLPRDRTVGKLGLKNRYYPRRFTEQLATPFTAGISDRDVPLRGMGQWLRRTLLWLRMQWVRVSVWYPLAQAAHKPRSAQDKVLMGVVHAGMATRFGQERNFAHIATYEDFVRAVAIQDYEALRPYIDAQERGEPAALTPEHPVMYAVTSGTTGEPKYLPVLARTLRQYQAGQQLFTLMLYRTCPEAFEGKAFGVASPAVEGHRPSGIPYGSVSGHLYASMPRLVRANYLIPPHVYALTDHALKYKVMLRLALAETNITYLAGANPSSFLQLLSVLRQSWPAFVESLKHGGMGELGELPADLAAVLAGRLDPCPERAAVLRKIEPTEISYETLWPNIRLLTVWTGGSCGVALDALKHTLSAQTRVIELGFLASELRVTVTADPVSGAGLPMLNQHFYEFVERGAWEAGERQGLRLHELRQGAEYYVIVTTASGLYRYFMNDIVRVVGQFNETPTLCFVQKGRGVTNITGEKVYEHQMLEAAGNVLSRNRMTPVFIMALADAAASVYRVYVEPAKQAGDVPGAIADEMDAELCRLNIEYAAKRASGRLAKLSLSVLAAGAGDAYRQSCVADGQREGQFKPILLQTLSELAFPIERYVVKDDAYCPA